MGAERRLSQPYGSPSGEAPGPPAGGESAGDVAPPGELPGVRYALAFLAYVALSLAAKPVFLNWIVGPFFLLAALYALPSAVARIGVRLGARRR